jgi:ribosomal protein S18 acetylase RimI-like enzyme
MPIQYRPMQISDHPAVMNLWQHTEGVGLSSADEPEAIESYLARNPGISQVAYEGDHLAGAALCGHDGRRGLIHHLAVAESHRKQGIGRELVKRCFDALARAGIQKCHIFVFEDNLNAIEFWKRVGWTQRYELVLMSRLVET